MTKKEDIPPLMQGRAAGGGFAIVSWTRRMGGELTVMVEGRERWAFFFLLLLHDGA
jgi:hypothetical protein